MKYFCNLFPDRARDTVSNKMVALKKMRLHTQKDGNFVIRSFHSNCLSTQQKNKLIQSWT